MLKWRVFAETVTNFMIQVYAQLMEKHLQYKNSVAK